MNQYQTQKIFEHLSLSIPNIYAAFEAAGISSKDPSLCKFKVFADVHANYEDRLAAAYSIEGVFLALYGMKQDAEGNINASFYKAMRDTTCCLKALISNDYKIIESRFPSISLKVTC